MKDPVNGPIGVCYNLCSLGVYITMNGTHALVRFLFEILTSLYSKEQANVMNAL